jgi:hypothetical protein
MPVYRADFTGDIKSGNRFLHRIEHSLVDIVLRPPWVLFTIGQASTT